MSEIDGSGKVWITGERVGCGGLSQGKKVQGYRSTSE